MATFTENYNLIKPSEEDYYDVTDFNENLDAIDTQMALNEKETEGIRDLMGTFSDDGTETMFGKLNQISTAIGQGTSLIKSIQHPTSFMGAGVSSGSVSFNAVDTNKTLVIMERLKDESSSFAGVKYTLSSDKISFSITGLDSNRALWLGFWVIEFC